MRTIVRMFVIALVAFGLSACEGGGRNPNSPTPGPSPVGPPVQPPVDGIYTWSVPAGRFGGTNFVPADCIKVQLVELAPGVGGTIPSTVGTTVYLKWRMSVCAEAPTPPKEGYRIDTTITQMWRWDILTSFGGGSYGPVPPGQSRDFETRPIVSNDGLPPEMPAFGIAISVNGGWYSFPDGIDYPRTWFVLNWKRG